jgi:hypothetical protein
MSFRSWMMMIDDGMFHLFRVLDLSLRTLHLERWHGPFPCMMAPFNDETSHLDDRTLHLYDDYTLLSLKFRPHMATRTQHRQTVMKSFMALNLFHSIPKRSKTIQSSEKLKSALQKLGARAHAWNRNVPCAHTRTMRGC